jgi:hypothetical protein
MATDAPAWSNATVLASGAGVAAWAGPNPDSTNPPSTIAGLRTISWDRIDWFMRLTSRPDTNAPRAGRACIA